MINLTLSTPPKELSKHIRKIFYIESRGETKHLQKVIPNPFPNFSFFPKLVPIPNVNNKIEPIVKKLNFSGPIIDKDVVLEYFGKIDHLVYEFTASGFYSLFHRSPSKIIDELSPFGNIISSKICRRLEKELSVVNEISQQKKIIEEFLIERSKLSLPVCKYVAKALEIANNHKGYISVNSLADQVNIGPRQLRRKFKEIVGLSPKTYCEVLQVHYIITFIQMKDYKSIQDIANNSDFFDLAHFCRTFKKIMHFQPTEFINSKIVDFSKSIYTIK